ncbi:PfkB domain protein [Beutenbergia cavernae DSM 12333]|uniref:PfkB domain protein n=1 Tax=Beutenbergia cavernae (strain ATCC BAA-8 / DSM 12333 / CCUG 43141 / JCM 11478 / NBRC 16432 / NCIMB 13614 / HKI 0122) TaxID=471853 RepID=C5C3W9_BEUC1|nr:sugar kinase [Beutenbergia cavernae]ACQ79882.1 PfkB domain protein [Beutenbergia cavernae DSM 12333]
MTSDAQRELDAVVLGESMVSLATPGTRFAATPSLAVGVAGAEGNVAIGLARLGRATSFLGAVGADPMGETIRRTLRGEGVDTTHLRTDPAHPTGLMVKEVVGPDDVRVYYYRSTSAFAHAGADLGAAPPSSRLVHATGITAALGDGPAAALRTFVTGAKARGAVVSFDMNLRRRLTTEADAARTTRDLLPDVDHLLLSGEEAQVLTGHADPHRAMAALLADGVPTVVVRLGEEGAMATDGDAEVEIPAAPARVVDTVGAGDAFTAGYLHVVLDGGPLPDAVRSGAWTAARVVEHHGDYTGFPPLAEYEDWRAQRATLQR